MHTNLDHGRSWRKWAPSLFFAIAIFLFSSVPEKEVKQSYDRLAITLQTISSTATAVPVASTMQTISATSTTEPAQTLSPTLPPAQPVVTPTPEIPFPAVPAFLSFLQLDWLKVGHIVGYFWLGLTVLYALSARSRWSPFIALILCLLYGASDEFHQRFVSGRIPLATDVFIDTLSALIGIAVLLGMRKLKAFFMSLSKISSL